MSALIGSISSAPECERSQGPNGAYAEKYGVGGLAQTAGGEPFRMMVMIFRFHGPEVPIPDPEPLGENFEVLADTVAVPLPGIAREGMISRFEVPQLDGMTLTCVDVDTKNGAKSQTFIQICRAVAAPVDDAAIIKTAGDIAARYMVGVIP
ncbi:MAG: hypothetical protein JNL25_18080 [Rhodospirillaceae bacterium]|nr:hypothetical protein [Rhodospirillaceae bacterium]